MQHEQNLIPALRIQLKNQGLRGFLVPRADQFQGEYVPENAQRLVRISGFSGSAGIAAILDDRAAIFVDGRYTLQVRQQVDTALFEICHQSDQPLTSWLEQQLRPGDRLGFDPWLHTDAQVDQMRAACRRAGADLISCSQNLLDAVWWDRPAPTATALECHPPEMAGRSAADKRDDMAAQLRRDGLDAVILSDPTSVAWLLNIRANDVPHLPVALCFAVLEQDGSVDLFVQPDRLSPALAEHLGPQIRCHAPDRLEAHLQALGQRQARIRLDNSQAPHAAGEILRQSGASVDAGADPCAIAKSRKNPAELAGARAAHLRDAVAMICFLEWFSQTSLDELTAAREIDQLRRQHPACRDLSFATIAGAGPNGAIVHYQATAASNRALNPGDLFLLDSGGQYADGTTDITRTMAFGDPDVQQQEHYTLVLKGHIAVASAIFPTGTTGPQLDCLARHALWQRGLDYDHGTGHGVGSYLSVHEGPQRISKSGDRAVALQPGMILSNEPGYYRTGHYGIRLENLVAVQDMGIPAGGERPMLGFETLTLVPFDRALIRADLLTPEEKSWLITYHQRILSTLHPHLPATAASWLARACDLGFRV